MIQIFNLIQKVEVLIILMLFNFIESFVQSDLRDALSIATICFKNKHSEVCFLKPWKRHICSIFLSNILHITSYATCAPDHQGKLPSKARNDAIGTFPSTCHPPLILALFFALLGTYPRNHSLGFDLFLELPFIIVVFALFCCGKEWLLPYLDILGEI